MSSIRLENLTPFGRLALKLDNDFSELSRLGSQIAKVDIESDSGLDHAIKILNLVAQHGKNIADGMQEFSKCLLEARERSEAAIQVVGERAQLVQQRRQKQDQLDQRLRQVEEEVKTVNASLAGFKRQGKNELSEEEKRQITADLERLQNPTLGFIESAQAIKAEAGRLKFKRVEREAQSMIDTLQATRRKINLVTRR